MSQKPSKRQANQRKQAQKGLKSLRGQPEMYDEVKQRYTFALTPTARAEIQKMSQQFNLSSSELIERIGRGLVLLVHPPSSSEDV